MVEIGWKRCHATIDRNLLFDSNDTASLQGGIDPKVGSQAVAFTP